MTDLSQILQFPRKEENIYKRLSKLFDNDFYRIRGAALGASKQPPTNLPAPQKVREVFILEIQAGLSVSPR